MSVAGPHRLPTGGLIDRRRLVRFMFNDRTCTGFAGDSLASALLANGIRTVARSFKFHRPRGIFSCGSEEPGALLQVGEGATATPSARAPLIELSEGLQCRAQAGFPSVNFDIGRSLDWLAPLWAAGFYNKTFIWPSWHTYEPIIRRLAGLGRAPSEKDPDRYDVGNLHCDVLVVGGGVAGLKAALSASADGARVVLVEQDWQFGGEASWSGGTIDSTPANVWLSQMLEQLRQRDVRLFSRTTATGYYDHNIVALLERTQHESNANAPRERHWTVRTARVVLATGCIEQPLIFEHNDRPGIMLAGAARQYLRRYGVAVGSRVLIATNNDSVYALAGELKAAGVAVCGVADSRAQLPDAIRRMMSASAVEVFPASIPVRTAGFGALSRVTLAQLSADGSRIVSERHISCDALAVSGGFNPALHLYAHAGGKLAFEESTGSLCPQTSGAFWPATRHPHIEIVGAAAERIPIGPRFSPVGNSARKWVDLLHDVTVADLELALRENYTSIEHAKRYTTAGMAPDQGKTSAPSTLHAIARLRGVAAHELGYTTLRPPVTPVTLGAIAGREIGELFAPHRHLPLHDRHVAHGALIQDFGGWRRPVAYLRAGESRESAVRREVHAVRNAAGLFDASPLGKIEIHGPDALGFLNQFYINELTTLKPYRVRYGLMLRETGTLFDDGTVVMLAPDRFIITTTSGNAGRVVQWLEEWRQCEWLHMQVAILPVTEHWATLSLAGPKARAILTRLDTNVDLCASAFPHLTMREGNLLGFAARIYRVSFTGELSYEINVPASRAQAVWEALIEAGTPDGLEPFGIDALQLLRLEKGFLHLGTDTDGTTIPDDVGWGKVAAGKHSDFIGKRSLRLPAHVSEQRMQLVGLRGARGTRFIVGSHLRTKGSAHSTDGWITSAGTAVLTDEPIALAMLRAGRGKIGQDVDLYDAGVVQASGRVVTTPFIDAAGERMNA